MGERVCNQFANSYLGDKLHLFAKRILDDLVLGELAHHKLDQFLKSDRVPLACLLIQPF